MSSVELSPGVVHEIPIDQIIPDASQPRQAFREKPLEELAASIKARGVLQPITVVPSGEQYMIKMGERRWRAAGIAGLEVVPCLLDTAGGDADDLTIDQLAENDLRENLNPIDRATALQRLKDERGLGPKDIAKLLERNGIKMSRPAISNTIRLLKLPEKAQQLVADGRLKESYARLLVPYSDYPKVIEEVVASIEAEEPQFVDPDWIRETIVSELCSAGEEITGEACCTECTCMVKAKDWNDRDRTFCMDPEKLAGRRAEAAAADEKEPAKGATPPAPKKPETDPTKATPKKVTPNKKGIVSLARRSYDSFNRLDAADFDKSDCEGCPHRHQASHSGDPDLAAPVCFYPPCFDNLKRQHAKILNRLGRIRELIDNQLLPVLIQTCATEPVSQVLALPLLAYAGANFPADERAPVRDGEHFYLHTASPPTWGGGDRSTTTAMHELPKALKRGTLSAYLEPDLSFDDCSAIVEAVIRALNLEQRRELALYMSIDVASFWANSEEYAKLFTKPEIIGLIGDKYDPPDVPAGEWRARLVDTAGVPALVREIWSSPIDNVERGDDVDEDGERAAA